MRKMRLEKCPNVVNKITWSKGGEMKETVVEKSQEKVDNFETEPKTIMDLLAEVDRTDEGRSLFGDEKKENFRDIRKCFVVTDKIIDKEL